jgi:hypothetical protein
LGDLLAPSSLRAGGLDNGGMRKKIPIGGGIGGVLVQQNSKKNSFFFSLKIRIRRVLEMLSTTSESIWSPTSRIEALFWVDGLNSFHMLY